MSNILRDDAVSMEKLTSDEQSSGDESIYYSSDEVNDGAIVLANFIKGHEYNGGPMKIGDVFLDINHFRTVLNEYMVVKGFDIVRKYSEPRRYAANCKEEGCSWHISGGRLSDESGFVIRKFNDTHSCRLTKDSVHVTFPWVTTKIENMVAVDRDVKVKYLLQFMQETYGVTVPRLCMYRARERARETIFGTHKQGYEKLFHYAEAPLKADPEIMCKVLSDNYSYVDKVLFHRFFVAFPAKKNAFLNGCRPFIGVDGCHLKGKYGGVILAAVGIDGNNSMVPLALCVCEKENTEMWTWFFKMLYWYMGDGRHVTIVSDRQKGCVAALNSVWPHVIHRPCCRHIYANFSKIHSGSKLRMLFWKAAKSSNKADFEQAMNQIHIVKPEAHKWLVSLSNEYNWPMYTYDSHCKVEKTDNNASETFNSWILSSRDKPCMTMLEEIRCQLMKMWTDRCEEVAVWTDATNIPPRIRKKLEAKKKEGMKMVVQPCGELNFQEKSFGKARRFVVRLGLRSCDCCWWKISGLPCSHALACLYYARHPIEDYVPPCYSKQACMVTYSVMFAPLGDECTWDPCARPLLLPPNISSKIGRPKKARMKPVDEPKKFKKRFFNKCKICGGVKHNSRTCPLKASSSVQPPIAISSSIVQSNIRKEITTTNSNKRGTFRNSEIQSTQACETSSPIVPSQASET